MVETTSLIEISGAVLKLFVQHGSRHLHSSPIDVSPYIIIYKINTHTLKMVNTNQTLNSL